MNEIEIISIIVSIIFGVTLFFINIFFLSKIIRSTFFQIALNVITISIPLVTTFLVLNYKERVKKEREFYFSSFLRDFVENIRSGKSIVSSLETLKENDYKSLSSLIKKMYLEVKLGIPFDKAINNLARRSESKIIKRISLTLGEALKSGGDVSSIIEAIIRSMIEAEKIKREREMISAPTKINGFMIYFMFLIVMIILIRFLIPSIHQSQQTQQINININEIKDILTHLIIIQSFFNGLLIGKLTEGSVIPGFRYSIILVIIGYIIFSLLT